MSQINANQNATSSAELNELKRKPILRIAIFIIIAIIIGTLLVLNFWKQEACDGLNPNNMAATYLASVWNRI